MSQRRQLAAIMFTDIEGYTAMMQENEQQAIEWRNRHREVLQREHILFDGRVIQFYGDGTLSIFTSAINAVTCALAMQREFRRPPSVPVRIGLHSGDIIFDDEEVFGDGVNVASRIESLGVAGSVLVSEKIYDELGNHPEFAVVSMGSYQFKNVKREIEVFSLDHPELVVPPPKTLKGKLEQKARNAAPKKRKQDGSLEKSIAVLPFINLSNDPEQDYFSEGIGEEILNSLSKLQDLKVASRSSSFQFNTRNVNLDEVKEKLGVKTVLQGSIRKQGHRLRLMVQLVSVDNGFHLWSEKYDRTMDDVFAIQDEVALSITEKLKGTLLDDDKAIITKNHTPNVEAYELYLKGRYHLNKRGAAILTAIHCFQLAIDMDPSFVLAHTGYADANLSAGFYSLLPPQQVAEEARRAAMTALKLDNKACEPYCSLGCWYTIFEWDWKEAERNYLKSLAINPRYAQAHFWYGSLFLAWVKGDFIGAISHGRIAIELEPMSPIALGMYGSLLYAVGHYSEALHYCRKGIEGESDVFTCHLFLGLSHLALGQYKEGVEVLENLYEISHHFHLAQNALIIAYCKVWKFKKAQALMEELKEKARHEYVAYTMTGVACAYMEELDEAFDLLEKAFQVREPLLLALKYQSWVPESLKQDPRYEAILGRIGYP